MSHPANRINIKEANELDRERSMQSKITSTNTSLPLKGVVKYRDLLHVAKKLGTNNETPHS
jgi:hypothetical protein